MGALEASAGGQVAWDELRAGRGAPRACTGRQADVGGTYIGGQTGSVHPRWGDQSLGRMDVGQMDGWGFVVGMLIPCRRSTFTGWSGGGHCGMTVDLHAVCLVQAVVES